MIKTFVFIEGGDNPFALSGQDASDQIRSILPDIAGYIQTKALGESPFSGCAELYFRSPEAADLVSLAELATLVPASATQPSSTMLVVITSSSPRLLASRRSRRWIR